MCTLSEANENHIPLDLSAVPAIEEFIGREEELNSLRQYLQPGSSQTRRIAIVHGLGGIGKTQLAIHFARKYRVNFTAIFWLSGKDRSSLVSSLSSCLPQIQGQPIGAKAANEEEAVQRENQVLQWLARPGNTGWLIIFDNIDQYSPLHGHGDCGYDIYEFFPKADHGSIMITSRLQGITELGKSFPVRKLMRKDATQLLLQSSGFSATDIAQTGTEQGTIIPALLENQTNVTRRHRPCKPARRAPASDRYSWSLHAANGDKFQRVFRALSEFLVRLAVSVGTDTPLPARKYDTDLDDHIPRDPETRSKRRKAPTLTRFL
jgi:hypothetical protein